MSLRVASRVRKRAKTRPDVLQRIINCAAPKRHATHPTNLAHSNTAGTTAAPYTWKDLLLPPSARSPGAQVLVPPCFICPGENGRIGFASQLPSARLAQAKQHIQTEEDGIGHE